MITDMRPDARIILHRDRDFRTEKEMRFELATAASERQRNGVSRVVEVFTPLNDIEHSFTQSAHLKEAFNNLAPELIDTAITDVTAFSRDILVNAAREARRQIGLSLYDSPRKRGKPEWDEVDMPNNPPSVNDFVPANGLVPVSFVHTHGKILMNGLRPKLHGHVGGATQVVTDKIYTVTNHLQTPAWMEAFNPPPDE